MTIVRSFGMTNVDIFKTYKTRCDFILLNSFEHCFERWIYILQAVCAGMYGLKFTCTSFVPAILHLMLCMLGKIFNNQHIEIVF